MGDKILYVNLIISVDGATRPAYLPLANRETPVTEAAATKPNIILSYEGCGFMCVTNNGGGSATFYALERARKEGRTQRVSFGYGPHGNYAIRTDDRAAFIAWAAEQGVTAEVGRRPTA